MNDKHYLVFGLIFSSLILVNTISAYAIDTFDGGLDGWVYSGTSGYSLSNNNNMAHISGNGFSVNPHAEKTFDVSNADSVTLSFDWRASSTCSCSSTTNFRLMILDISGNTLSSQTLQTGGTTDTGIQSYSADITSTISGHDSIVIRMWLNDSWSNNWNQKIWWDNVDLQITTSQQDITPPIITLTGANPQTIELGNGYTELGATTDDGSAVTIDSSNFVDSIGSYSVIYNSVDSSGNNAATKTRTVTVVDTVIPGQENIIVSDVKPCFLLENQTILTKLKKCGFGDDFLVYSFTGFEWITGGNFTLAIASILILFSYVKYHKASYPLIIGVAMLPISYNFFPVEFLSFAFVMTALVLTVLCWHIFIRQTKEY